MKRKPYIVVEVKEPEVQALCDLVDGLSRITRAKNPLDDLATRMADAEGPQHNAYRCTRCKGYGWEPDGSDLPDADDSEPPLPRLRR